MLERIAVDTEADVGLVGSLRVHLDARVSVVADPHRRRLTGLGLRHVPKQLLDALVEAVSDLAADTDHHPRRLVPVVEIRRERVTRRVPDRLPAPDDVPTERLVAVEQLLVQAADEIARRVEVHVHLLDDDALLALDLLRIELRVTEHVDEDVERDVARLARTL